MAAQQAEMVAAKIEKIEKKQMCFHMCEAVLLWKQ